MFSDILDYIVFCNETSMVYPFATQYEDITLGDIHRIEFLTNGSSDTEIIHYACTVVLGINE